MQNREMGIRYPRPLQQSYGISVTCGRSLMAKRTGVRLSVDLNGEDRQQGDRPATWCIRALIPHRSSLESCVYHTAPRGRVASGRAFLASFPSGRRGVVKSAPCLFLAATQARDMSSAQGPLRVLALDGGLHTAIPPGCADRRIGVPFV